MAIYAKIGGRKVPVLVKVKGGYRPATAEEARRCKTGKILGANPKGPRRYGRLVQRPDKSWTEQPTARQAHRMRLRGLRQPGNDVLAWRAEAKRKFGHGVKQFYSPDRSDIYGAPSRKKPKPSGGFGWHFRPDVERYRSNPKRLPKWDPKRGWVGGDSLRLYAFTDRRTGQVVVAPGRHAHTRSGPEATVRPATRAEAEAHWQRPLHSGWKVNPKETAEWLEEMKAKGWKDPESRSFLKEAKAAGKKAAAGLGGFLQHTAPGSSARPAGWRKGQQASMFTGEEMGGAQRDLFPRKRNPLGLDKRPDYISPRDWKTLGIMEAEARRLRRFEAGGGRLRSGAFRRTPSTAYGKIRGLGAALKRRGRTTRNPKGAKQLKDLHDRATAEIIRMRKATGWGHLAADDWKRLTRLERVADIARYRHGFAQQGRGSLHPKTRVGSLRKGLKNPTGYPFSGDPDEGGKYRPVIRDRGGHKSRPRFELDEDMGDIAARHMDIAGSYEPKPKRKPKTTTKRKRAARRRK